MALHKRRSNSAKTFCTIPSHRCSSLDYYCNTCCETVCHNCTILTHSDHDTCHRSGARVLEPEIYGKATYLPKDKDTAGRQQKFHTSSSEIELTPSRAQFAISGSDTVQKEQQSRLSNTQDSLEDVYATEEELFKTKIYKELKTKYKTVVQIWFGYRDGKMTEGDTILVVILSKDDKTIPARYNGFEIYKRVKDDVSNEAEMVMNSVASKQDYAIPINTQKELKSTITQNAEKLGKDHSNITIISYCPIKSVRAGAHFGFQEENCIVIYCMIKGIIPCGEKPFPKHIGRFPVDVREAVATFTAMHNDNLPSSDEHHTALRLGAEIGIRGQIGTLGMFIDLNNNKKGFITCAHLAVEKEQLSPNLCINYEYRNERIPVYQPNDLSPQCSIGCVKKATFRYNDRFKTSVDAALVEITNMSRSPIDGYMIRAEDEILRIAGFSSDSPPSFNSGQVNPSPSPGIRVIKCGATTGITTGMLCADGVYVRLENIHMSFHGDPNVKFEMYNQFDVLELANHRMFDLGDSGAIVFEVCGQNLKAVGMTIGGTSYGSIIVTPIRVILDELGLSLTKFSPGGSFPGKRKKTAPSAADKKVFPSNYELPRSSNNTDTGTAFPGTSGVSSGSDQASAMLEFSPSPRFVTETRETNELQNLMHDSADQCTNSNVPSASGQSRSNIDVMQEYFPNLSIDKSPVPHDFLLDDNDRCFNLASLVEKLERIPKTTTPQNMERMLETTTPKNMDDKDKNRTTTQVCSIKTPEGIQIQAFEDARIKILKGEIHIGKPD